MSFFAGYRFFVYFFCGMIPAAVLGMTGKPLRQYRMFLTFLFIVMVYIRQPAQLMYLVLYVCGACILVKLYLGFRVKHGRKAGPYGCAVLLALLPLIAAKTGGLFGKDIFGFLGISDICFRVIQVVIEIYDGVIGEIKCGDFVMFLVFFPSLSSGPIDRSRRFEADNRAVYKREEYGELLGTGLYKVILGMFYKIVCSGCFYKLLTDVFAGKYGILWAVGYAYVYGLYLFFDFAGYSSMAVGAGCILGIRLPDNFNRPFVSVDMKDFWNRWHITLSWWLRDFVFTRFMVYGARKKWFKDRLTRAFAGLMVNMMIMGLWHGPEIRYITYGIYHGLLLGITEVYQKKSGFYRKNRDKAWYKGISWALTMNLVMFGFLIFSGYVGEAARILAERL